MRPFVKEMPHQRPCLSKRQGGKRLSRAKKSHPKVKRWFYPAWEDLRTNECTECHLSFSTIVEGIDHILSSPSHLKCGLCFRLQGTSDVELFDTVEALHSHYKSRRSHHLLYCKHCERIFATLDESLDHEVNEHYYCCNICEQNANAYFPTLEQLEAHYKEGEHITESTGAEGCC